MVGGLSNLVARWVRQGVVVAALCLGASICGALLGWRLAPEELSPTAAPATPSPPQGTEAVAIVRPPLLEIPAFVDHSTALLEQQLIQRRVPSPTPTVAVQSQAFALSVSEPTAPPPVQPRTTAAALPSTPAPALGDGDKQTVSLSFYYCGANGGPRVGDGGGFCGHMANGQVVHAGAAACSAAYMGQRFRVEGDPYGRIYTCADTGGAVGAAHRDIWFDDAGVGWAWLQTVGFTATIEVVD